MGPVSRSKALTASATASLTAKDAADTTHAHIQGVDTPMADAPTANTKDPSTSQNAKKRKRKEKETHILHQTTFRKPTWSYFHLALVTPGTAAQPPSASAASPDPRDIDTLTVSALLLHPLTAYLGVTGSAVPIDILHTQGRSAFVRIPRQDARAFRAGLSGWIGGCDAASVPGVQEGGRVSVAWRVVAEGGSLGLIRGSGEELFGERGAAY
ncbi:hypothetical protein C7974DRAFT_104383 [Boeremia exigua]|uniref:uncharacterized protein n=1 Tax=Boeremia exigua TaxID=749465 RepID=UPI001E8DE4F4|nr:uncharacterized protein C7974DRAFT_104383 [Boeremia exigua]KAH6642553.1 hypothetical protein C7974DRAFT_104383 [Boeremia exigua]